MGVSPFDGAVLYSSPGIRFSQNTTVCQALWLLLVNNQTRACFWVPWPTLVINILRSSCSLWQECLWHFILEDRVSCARQALLSHPPPFWEDVSISAAGPMKTVSMGVALLFWTEHWLDQGWTSDPSCDHQISSSKFAGVYSEPAEKAMTTHSSPLAWRIPWMEEPGRLQSMGLLRVRHDWATSLSLFTFMHWRRKWQPTPAFLPGESQGQRSLVDCPLWGRTESDTTEVT